MEVGAVPFHYGVESELGDSQHFALDIHNGAIPMFAVFFPQAHVQSFADHVLNNFFVVACGQSYQHDDALLDVGDGGSSNFDPALEDPLDNYAHEQDKVIRWLIIDPHIAIHKAMHSASTRFNGITLFTCSVLGVLCVVNWLQGYLLFNPQTHPELQITSMTNFINTSRWDQASFKYSLDADLSSLYTWNLKQLYVYVECEWTDPKTNLTSNSIVTDWILQLPEDKADLQKNWTIKVQNQRFDYLLRDVYHSLRGNSLQFSLKAQYMPIVGFFFKTRLSQLIYQMPLRYTNEAVK